MSDLAQGLPRDTLREVGDYQIHGRLGRGGMGTVYLGEHRHSGARVAIKVLAPHIVGDANLRERFLREARVVNDIHHPALISVFDFGELPDGRSYMVMELLEGESLAARIERGPFRWDELVSVFGQLLDGLQAAHDAGVIHRDLKPENIFLLPRSGAPPRVKIFDFGLAKLPAASMTRTGVALGTPRYMSPEQCRGKDVDHRTDLYAAGMMLYEAITGRLPFQSAAPLVLLSMQVSATPQPPSRFAELPDALEAVILRSIAKDPEQRFQQAHELRDALWAIAPADTPVDFARRSTPLPVPLTEQLTAGAMQYESTSEISRDLFDSAQQGGAPFFDSAQQGGAPFFDSAQQGGAPFFDSAQHREAPFFDDENTASLGPPLQRGLSGDESTGELRPSPEPTAEASVASSFDSAQQRGAPSFDPQALTLPPGSLPPLLSAESPARTQVRRMEPDRGQTQVLPAVSDSGERSPMAAMIIGAPPPGSGLRLGLFLGALLGLLVGVLAALLLP